MMRIGKVIATSLLTVSLVLACAAAVQAENWARFRGPNGAGIAADKDIPVQWDKTNILWKTPIPGMGNSSPVVWEDRIFLHSAKPDGSERLLICLNTDGKILWTKSVAGSLARTHLRNTMASSTPATDGERVYVLFWDGNNQTIHAYDFQGELMWSQPLGPYKSQHGAGHSPIVVKGLVILNNDQDGDAKLLALDATTGKPVWEAARTPFRACYSTPFLRQRADGSEELIVTTTAGITAYDPKNGAEHWSWTWAFDGMPLRTVGSAIAHNGAIYAISGDGSGARHMVAVKAGDKGDVTQTNLMWENKRTLPYVPSLLAKGDHIYFTNDRGIAGCCDAKTGEIVWSERLGGGFTASPVMIDGNIYAISEDGNVFVFPAEPEFKQLARNQLGEGVMASPAVSNNRLYIRGKEHLFCIGKPGK